MVPENLRYCKTHQWVKSDGHRVTIGITDHAQEELGEVVFMELPSVGADLEPDVPFGVIESVKAVSDLYCPVSGKVVEVNESLVNAPETANKDPYGAGWMIVVEMSDPSQADDLWTADQYRAFLESGGA